MVATGRSGVAGEGDVHPVAGSLKTSAGHAFATGLVKQADLTEIYDLRILREVLGEDVDDAGLGQEQLEQE